MYKKISKRTLAECSFGGFLLFLLFMIAYKQ